MKILSLNLFMRPPSSSNNESDWKDYRLNYFIEKMLDDFDICCFQEMFGSFSSRRNTLISAAKKKGFIYEIHSSKPFFSTFLVDGGLLILSKHPIIAHDSIIFDKGVQSDGLAAKGALCAVIQPEENPESKFLLFNTHLQASYLDNTEENAIRNIDIRKDQLKQLSKFIKNKSKDFKNMQIFVAGDWNVNAIFHAVDEYTGEIVPYENPAWNSYQYQHETEEYTEMLNILSNNNKNFEIIDLIKKQIGYHPVTLGDTDQNGKPRETILTEKIEQGINHSYDKIFEFKNIKKENVDQNPKQIIQNIKPNMEGTILDNETTKERTIKEDSGKDNLDQNPKQNIQTIKANNEETIQDETIQDETLKDMIKEGENQNIEEITKNTKPQEMKQESGKENTKQNLKHTKKSEEIINLKDTNTNIKKDETIKDESNKKFYFVLQCNIEEFLTKSKNFTQISDHYGISLILDFKTKKNTNLDKLEINEIYQNSAISNQN